MAKVSFTKLSLKEKKDIEKIIINEQEIEIKQYLPIDEKVNLITRVIQSSHNPDVNYYNPMLLEVLTTLEIIMSYTNINFTEKQKENTSKLYDILESNGIINQIIEKIPEEEYNFLIESIYETIHSIYGYQQSVLGILDAVSKDYSDLKLDAEEIQKNLADKDNLALVRDVLTKLG